MNRFYKVIIGVLAVLSLIVAYLLFINWDLIKNINTKNHNPRDIQNINKPQKIGYFLVDSNNNQISKEIFEDYNKSLDNRIIVKNNYKYGVIDYQGNYIIPVEYKSITAIPELQMFLVKETQENSVNRQIITSITDINGDKKLTAPDISIIRSYIITSDNDNYSIYNKNLVKLIDVKSTRRPYITYNNELKIYEGEKEKYINLLPPVTPYPSDFKSALKKGDYPRMMCDMRVHTNFCHLSLNGLSAQTNGRDSYYIVDKIKKSGKYYFEYQINSPHENIDYYSNFAIVDIKDSAWKDDNNIHTYNRRNLKNKDIVCVALDYDNRKVYISLNGSWNENNNPENPERGEKMYGKKFDNYLAFSVAGDKEELTVNFGMLPFKYDIPKGYAPYYTEAGK